MLGGDCSACCDACTLESRYKLWTSLLGMSCSVTLSGNLPRRDPGTYGRAVVTDIGDAYNWVGRDEYYSLQWRQSLYQIYKAFPDISGTYSLSLDMSQTQPKLLSANVSTTPILSFFPTQWSDNTANGTAIFAYTSESVDIYVAFSTAYQGGDGWKWPTTKCFVYHMVVVVPKPQMSYCIGLPQGLTPTRQSSTGTSFMPPYTTKTFTLETVSPPYTLAGFNPSLTDLYFFDSTGSLTNISQVGAWDDVLQPNSAYPENAWRTERLSFVASNNLNSVNYDSRVLTSSSARYEYSPIRSSGEFIKTTWISGDSAKYDTSLVLKYLSNLRYGNIRWEPMSPTNYYGSPQWRVSYSQSSKALQKETISPSAAISFECRL